MRTKQIIDIANTTKGYRPVITVASSRNISNADLGGYLACTSGVTLSIPAEGLPFIPNGVEEIVICRHGTSNVIIQATVLLVTLNGTLGGNATISTRWNSLTLKRLGINNWVAYN